VVADPCQQGHCHRPLVLGLRQEAVAGADDFEQNPQGLGGVEVVIHGLAEADGGLIQLFAQFQSRLRQCFHHRQFAGFGLQPENLVHGGQAAVDPFQTGLGIVQILVGKVDGGAVVGRQDEETQGLRIVLFQHRANGEKVAQGFAHLFVVDVDEAVVQPVAHELAAVGRLGLGDLVFVVGKDQVLAAAVEVEGLAQEFLAHGRTLDVPARSPLAPG